ncbi:Nucleoporin-domain-containing protein [Pleurostoma richardsiae]|uniref:Nucleoporin-domain-containing protein n=1 Tax=Pleurostoma richardsiae TaxID=41990 RepID=A0AA38VK41_9PEZI|nr:Nucleoporin-domain-containing protein [Pleurostoma richardsiae]
MATQTPMRQVPGAFLQTPAPKNDPVRRQLFSDAPPPGPRFGTFGTTPSSSTGQGAFAPASTSVISGGGLVPASQQQRQQQQLLQQQSQSSSENAAPLPPILRAARSVNQVLQLDESFPDIDSYCRPGASSDYDLQFFDSSWAPFHKVHMYTIPDAVMDIFNSGNLHTDMGLFPEINHAWVVIDSGVFLWDYTLPNPELVGFEDTPHAITGVALVPPKTGVFVKSITHMLVVATVQELILLGVSATPTPTGTKTISLYQTKMSLHKSGADVSIITASANGRIFFGGSNDTDVYELYYQQEEKWFSSRCGKINHTHPGWSSVVPVLPSAIVPWTHKQHEHLVDIVIDDTRNLLYTLSSRSTIRTYYMESPDKLTKVIEKDKMACLRDITHMISSSPLLTDRMTIVSISPISAREASKLHLMALTDTGCRIYLSATSSASYMLGSSSNVAPQSMQVQFIKFPPREQPDRRSSQIGANDSLDLQSRALQASSFGRRFAPGYFFDIVSKSSLDAQADFLFVSAPETGRIKATTPASALKFYEHANWIELDGRSRATSISLLSKPFAAAAQPLGFGNELAVQFDDPPSEFAVMTSTGVHIIRRRRLVDIFAAAIRGAAGDEGLERETRKFISLYGRVETVSAALAVACGQGSDSRTTTGRVNDQNIEDRAKAVFVDFGGQPTLAETDGTQDAADVKLSSRHDALALYLTRLIRSLWKSKVIVQGVDPTGGIVIGSSLPTSKLNTVQDNLQRLKNFLEANKGTIRGLSGPSDLQRVASRQEEIALQAEHQALHALQKLMDGISEGISFVLMLFDERVSDIYLRLDPTSQQELKQLTYEKLFSQQSGKDLAKLLVKAIVNRNIESGSNVETVADALRRRCGSFCSPEDVVIFKAQEQLKKASEPMANPNIVRQLLSESLRLFERVAGSLSFANLRSAVEQYNAMKYYAGAIQLCLTVARERDRGNSALSWINEGRPANDPRKGAFDARKRCYDLIHETMQNLDAISALEPEMIDGKMTLTATKRAEAYSVVNDSDDEVFHVDLYEWYIDQNWTERILAIESPHVINFLQRLAATDARHADLLCRFYTHRNRFFEAAQVQADLAKSDFAIGIKDRITLLSRAKGNASVSTTGVSRQQQQMLNHEVTELLEIAHIQDDLLERLKADGRIPDERKAEVERALDGPIQGLTELFNNYADQAGYYDLCLLIYHAADYHNPRVIAETWAHLIKDTHDDIVERRAAWEEHRAGRVVPDGIEIPDAEPPQPYESVSLQIQTIAHRTSLDSLIFPIDTLLTMVCEYAVANQQDETILADPAWPVLLFLGLGVSHAMVTRVLERIFDAQEAPFTGRRRRTVVRWIDTVIEGWMREVERRGLTSAGKGETGLGAWVVDLLGRADEAMSELYERERTSRTPPHALAATEEIYRQTRRLRQAVDSIVITTERGSLRFV